MFRDKLIAAARTGFAVLGAAIVTWVVNLLGGWGVIVEVDETWSTLLAGLMFAVFVGLYNLLVAWLTENVWDGFGWLLGVNKMPAYVKADLRDEPDGVAVDTGLPQVQGGQSYHDFLAETDPHN